MFEWWTYSPEDFLMFSPRVYWRLFELSNAALWPLPLVTQGLALAAALLALRPKGRRLALAILATFWALVAGAFLWRRYGPINWVVFYAAPLFALEAAGLALVAARGRITARPTAPRLAAGGILLLVALAYPLLAPLTGRPLSGAEVFGMAPDPTAMGTLGVLLLAGGAGAALWPIPVAWCLFSAMTLWTLGTAQGWLPFAAALLAPLVALVSRAPGPAGGSPPGSASTR